MSSPHHPPLTTTVELPPLALAEGLEAFEVHEVPSYPACGEGPHWYVQVRKRGMTTRDAMGIIARAADVPLREVGSAGQKDKWAVTTQWLSVPSSAESPDTWDLPHDVSIDAFTQHTNKLKTGHVSANRFRLTFAGDATAAFEPATALMAKLSAEGLPNYFGRQRFGRGGRNLESALAWAQGEIKLRGSERKFKSSLYASVTLRTAVPAPLITGEVVRLSGSRSVFVVEDVDAELPRVASGDIVQTGPMFGPKMRAPAAEAAELESQAFLVLGMDVDAVSYVARNAPGTRRDLLVKPTEARVEMAGPDRLVLDFTLPSGSYATQVAREFTRLSWANPLRPENDD